MAYPTDEDLKELLYGAGLIANPPTGAAAVWNYDRAVGAGIRRVEHETHRSWAGAAAYAKEFDPPTNRDKRIFVGEHTAVTSIFYLDVEIAATEYLSGPLNARDASPIALPFSYIEFFREWWAPTPWAQRAQLVVTATWGSGADVPEDVAQAMLYAAGLALWPQIASFVSRGGLVSAKQADAAFTWSERPLMGLRESWQDELGRVVAQYRDWSAALV
jgi:hypothetical protein